MSVSILGHVHCEHVLLACNAILSSFRF